MGGGDGETRHRGEEQAEDSGQISGKPLNGTQVGETASHGVDDALPAAKNAEGHHTGTEKGEGEGDEELMDVPARGKSAKQKEEK